MNNDRDPRLAALFQATPDLPADEAFTESIDRAIESRRHRILAGRIVIVLAIVAIELLLNLPIQSSLGAVAELLNTSLVPTGESWLSTLLSPVNSVAGLVGVVLVAVHYLYRRFMY